MCVGNHSVVVKPSHFNQSHTVTNLCFNFIKLLQCFLLIGFCRQTTNLLIPWTTATVQWEGAAIQWGGGGGGGGAVAVQWEGAAIQWGGGGAGAVQWGGGGGGCSCVIHHESCCAGSIEPSGCVCGYIVACPSY